MLCSLVLPSFKKLHSLRDTLHVQTLSPDCALLPLNEGAAAKESKLGV